MANHHIVRHADLEVSHRKMVAEIMSAVEESGLDEDSVKRIRKRVRYWSHYLSHSWHLFIGRVLDSKYLKYDNSEYLEEMRDSGEGA